MAPSCPPSSGAPTLLPSSPCSDAEVKNFLFVGHPRAARNIAALYSLVASCVANGVEPTEYLTDVLARVRDAKTEDDLDALLPDR